MAVSRWMAGMTALFVPCLVLAQPAGRVVIGKATSPAATFAARGETDAAFRVLGDKADLFPGELLVALPGAGLDSKNGAVALKSYADYDSRSPLPILETAVVLHENPAVDLDFTLDRGRVDLTNKKPSGAATARVRFWGQTWIITLETPGTRVALELCGRWPTGARFRPADAKAPGKGESPVASLVLLVLEGAAQADVGGVSVALKAPPGPALLEWDSVAGVRPQPQRLEKLPEWADPNTGLTPEGAKTQAAVEKFRAARAANPAEALAKFLDSTDPAEQRVALVTLGATDDLVKLGQELAEAKTAEEWDFGITVLRHWLGRCPGQDQKLFQTLTTARGYTPNQARIVLQLLFGFTPAEIARPETYEVLIEYLRHDKPGIRNIAAWHLVRLVPAGKAIAWKPAGTPAEADQAYAAWKKLVPAGTLPAVGKK